MLTDCLEALKKSFHVFVIFHLVTILAQTYFKETLFHFCWRNKQKGDLGDFGWEASFIPLRLVLFSASVIFLLICPKLIALSLLDNVYFQKKSNRDHDDGDEDNYDYNDDDDDDAWCFYMSMFYQRGPHYDVNYEASKWWRWWRRL